MTTASALIERARSLADLKNSKFISYEDEVSSLNESYRDIYSWLCNSDDDYFAKEIILTGAVAPVPSDPNSAMVTLPADFYKLRFIDYRDQGYWIKVRKYAPEGRNSNPGTIQYRFYGSQLRLIGMQSVGLNAQLRLTYYPPSEVITLPEYAYAYGTSMNAYDRIKFASPVFVAESNTLLYIYNGVTIKSESIDLNTVSTPNTLYTDAGLSNLAYKQGYIYFLKGGEIYRATTNLSSTITPVAITTSGGLITSFSIQGSMLYYSTSTPEFRSFDLVSLVDSLISTNVASNACVAQGSLCYIDGSGNIVIGATTTSLSAVNLTSNGTDLFYLDSAGVIHRVEFTAPATIDSDNVIRHDVLFLGSYNAVRLPIIDADYDMLAVSSIPDWEFVYPLNEVNEIIAYQCAIDFKRKQNADFTQLSMRMADLQHRFIEVIRRDEGLPTKIGNAYSQYDSMWR